MDILLVDDDALLADATAAWLREHGATVRVSTTVPDARQRLSERQPDVCVLDIVLPGVSGRVFCRELTERTSTGVIMMSSLGTDEDRIALLELGADDYLVKPFNPLELLARIRAVMRRSGRHRPPVAIQLGTWTFDADLRRLSDPAGRTVALTPGEVAVLRFLTANPGLVVGRADLLAVSRTRQHGGSTDRAIDNLIKRLRRKIETDPERPTLIRTEWGKGYVYRPDPGDR